MLSFEGVVFGGSLGWESPILAPIWRAAFLVLEQPLLAPGAAAPSPRSPGLKRLGDAHGLWGYSAGSETGWPERGTRRPGGLSGLLPLPHVHVKQKNLRTVLGTELLGM